MNTLKELRKIARENNISVPHYYTKTDILIQLKSVFKKNTLPLSKFKTLKKGDIVNIWSTNNYLVMKEVGTTSNSTINAIVCKHIEKKPYKTDAGFHWSSLPMILPLGKAWSINRFALSPLIIRGGQILHSMESYVTFLN